MEIWQSPSALEHAAEIRFSFNPSNVCLYVSGGELR